MKPARRSSERSPGRIHGIKRDAQHRRPPAAPAPCASGVQQRFSASLPGFRSTGASSSRSPGSPAAASRAAATELSTPPLMATTTLAACRGHVPTAEGRICRKRSTCSRSLCFPKRHPQRAERPIRRQPQGGQHFGRLRAAGLAGRAGRAGKPIHIQQHQQGVAIHASKDKAGVVGQALARAARSGGTRGFLPARAPIRWSRSGRTMRHCAAAARSAPGGKPLPCRRCRGYCACRPADRTPARRRSAPGRSACRLRI